MLLEKEINYLESTLENPKLPFTAVLGGAKVSDKVKVVDRLTRLANNICIGGGMAATFLVAENKNVGNSAIETDFVGNAQILLDQSASAGAKLVLPTDVVVVKTFERTSEFSTKSVENLADDDIIVDIGPNTASQYASIIGDSQTVLWNGPMGVYEWENS